MYPSISPRFQAAACASSTARMAALTSFGVRTEARMGMPTRNIKTKTMCKLVFISRVQENKTPQLRRNLMFISRHPQVSWRIGAAMYHAAHIRRKASRVELVLYTFRPSYIQPLRLDFFRCFSRPTSLLYRSSCLAQSHGPRHNFGTEHRVPWREAASRNSQRAPVDSIRRALLPDAIQTCPILYKPGSFPSRLANHHKFQSPHAAHPHG